MRLRSINGLRCKQLKLVLLAFFKMFILWKWEEGTYYNAEDIHPDSLVVSHPGHFKHIDIPLFLFLHYAYLYSHFSLNFCS